MIRAVFSVTWRRLGWACLAVVAVACGARSDIDQPSAVEDISSGGSGGTGIVCPSCRMLGWSCAGPDAVCCDGLPCVNVPDGKWFCGGVRAGGQDTGCAAETDTCFWKEPTVCPESGPISGFCGPDARVVALRRCDGSCFAPDELYQTFFIRSCEASGNDTPCPQGTCGPIWDAAYCCS
jgi:hypothetical protein